MNMGYTAENFHHFQPWQKTGLVWLLAVVWLVGAFPMDVLGVEFTDPPGQNVEQQEARLKEEISRYAKSVMGKDLIDVVVDIGYARTGKGGGGKIKLPGFNRYINPSGKGGEILPEYIRVRQVFVMVSSAIDDRERESLKNQLISQAELDRTKGDRVEVVAVGASDGDDGSKGSPGMGTTGKIARRAPPMPKNEPESTVYLLRARESYFKGDHERALRNILKAINLEPNSSQAYAMLGSVYYTLNWKSLALKYWNRSLVLDPDNQELEELVDQLDQEKS